MEPLQQSEISSVLRPLSVGELLDRAFSLYRQHFLLFFGIAVIPSLIDFASKLVGDIPFSSRPFSPGHDLWMLLGLVASLVMLVLYLWALVLSQAATMFAVASSYLQRPIPVREAYAKARPYAGSLFWLLMQSGIRIGLALLLLVVPGILLALNYSVSVPVAIFEDLRGKDALDRSTNLTEGYRGRIFALYLLFWLVSLIAGFSIEASVKILPGSILWSSIFPQLINFLTSSLIDPILLIVLALVYYDLRVRKEAFDLQFMMTSLDAAGDQAQAAKA